MPLTNAEKQARHRQRQRAKMERMEGALREIAAMQPYSDPADAAPIALAALGQFPTLHIEL